MITEKEPTQRLINLIKVASAGAGNYSKMALRIGETKHNVSAWVAGSRPCPVEAQILMAKVAQLDINATIRSAFIEKHEGSLKGDLLLVALGKSLSQSDN